jgi:prepilin-type N-terminal cleavage/methylation domain-containing protein
MFLKSKINHFRQKGFTLIELLVVISIIALLSSIVLASLNSARGKARTAAQQVAIDQTKKALQLYWTDNGGFPEDVQTLIDDNYISDVDESLMTYTTSGCEGEFCDSYSITANTLGGGGENSVPSEPDYTKIIVSGAGTSACNGVYNLSNSDMNEGIGIGRKDFISGDYLFSVILEYTFYDGNWSPSSGSIIENATYTFLYSTYDHVNWSVSSGESQAPTTAWGVQ